MYLTRIIEGGKPASIVRVLLMILFIFHIQMAFVMRV